MAVGGKQEGVVVTGGGDSTVALWRDSTAANAEAAAEEEAAAVLKQQDLENALQVESSTLSPNLWRRQGYKSLRLLRGSMNAPPCDCATLCVLVKCEAATSGERGEISGRSRPRVLPSEPL